MPVTDTKTQACMDALGAVKAGSDFDPVDVAEVLINNSWFLSLQERCKRVEDLYRSIRLAREEGLADPDQERLLADELRRLEKLLPFA